MLYVVLRRSILDDLSEPVVDLRARLLQLRRIVIFRSVKFSAVPAIVAIADARDLVELLLGCARSSPLPRVFTAVGKENVRA